MSCDGIELLDNPVQPYACGSRTSLAALLGRSQPSATPEAELWIGAHPQAPSRLARDGRRLDDVIRADPEPVLGAALLRAFGPELPFLLKVLAVERPLSLQVHPDASRARAGFAREEREGLPRDAPTRCYRDPNPKAEIVCALTDFELLAGFRSPADVADRLEALAVPALGSLAEALRESRDGLALRGLLDRLLRTPKPEAEILVGTVTRSLARQPNDPERTWVGRLAAEHPTDPAVLAPLFLHHARLAPGEAMFLAPGVPHSYLCGVGVELMDASDNVLRAGLTPKHVDVDELLETLSFAPGAPERLRPEPDSDGIADYRMPAASFRLGRISVERAHPRSVRTLGAPLLLLVTEGRVALRVHGREGGLVLQQGRAALVTAGVAACELDGEAVVYRATASCG